MKKLVLASSNAGKIEEIRDLVAPLHITVVTLRDIFGKDMDLVETGNTFQENALSKAQSIYDKVHLPVLADDSGLEVDAMDKRPGIYSARFMGKQTSYAIKNQYIIDAVKGKTRTARYVCAMCLCLPGQPPILIEETMEGEIHTEMMGDNGFGYDPIFYYPPCRKTTAQMTRVEKNKYSHRGKALRKLQQILTEVTL